MTAGQHGRLPSPRARAQPEEQGLRPCLPSCLLGLPPCPPLGPLLLLPCQGAGMPIPRGELHFSEHLSEKELPGPDLGQSPQEAGPEACLLSQLLLNRFPLTPFGAATVSPLTPWASQMS